MLTAQVLRQKLNLKPARLTALLKQGLPSKGKGTKRRFDPAAVAAWLREHGLARPVAGSRGSADQVATTISEAARLIPISTRVFASWLTDPTFPGKAGAPGRQDGYFPIQAIRTWHLATHGGTARGAPTDAELAAVKKLKAQIDCDHAQVELEKDLGTIHDTEAAARLIRRQIATAKALLEEAADKVESRLPGKVPRPIRAVIRKALEEVLAETLNAIAEMAAGDTDDADDTPDDDAAA